MSYFGGVLMAGMRWTKDELCRLKECYFTMKPKELMKQFFPRSISSINHAARSLGINSPRHLRNWRAICNAHKPRIVLAQTVPTEKI
jgi:hypothetical protein